MKIKKRSLKLNAVTSNRNNKWLLKSRLKKIYIFTNEKPKKGRKNFRYKKQRTLKRSKIIIKNQIKMQRISIEAE